MSVAIFTIIFMSLFGPKIAGVIDLSLLGGLFGLVFLARLKKIPVSREYVVIVMLVAVISIHSTAMVLFNGVEDIQPVLRHFRALISTILLGAFFYNLGSSNALSSAKLINIVVLILLVNATAIIVSIFMPEIKPVLAELYGFNKRFVGFRSFGLTAGYDTAGYFCIIGAALSAASAYQNDSARHSITILIFVAATFLTSRSSMVLATMLMIGVCSVFVLKGRWSLKVVSAGYILAVGSVAIYYVVPLILSTFALGVMRSSNMAHTKAFAATDLSSWYERMWILPDQQVAALIGAGEVVKTSDVGYVSLIFMIGIVGLLFVVLIYLYMFSVIKGLNRSLKRRCLQMDVGGRILVWSFMMIILLTFFINFKNLYFLTRGYHELIVILFFFILGLRDVARYRAQGQ